jgi:hypothetical protein
MKIRSKDKTHLPCVACRHAATSRVQDYKKRRILNGGRVRGGHWTVPGRNSFIGGHLSADSTGTRRRLQALGIMGYGWENLSERTGLAANNLGEIAKAKIPRIRQETADKIKALYDELSMHPREETRGVKMIKNRLMRHGWVGPLAWDDETIDDPYGLPSGLSKQDLWHWYCNGTTLHERMEWVLEHGFPKPVYGKRAKC